MDLDRRQQVALAIAYLGNGTPLTYPALAHDLLEGISYTLNHYLLIQDVAKVLQIPKTATSQELLITRQEYSRLIILLRSFSRWLIDDQPISHLREEYEAESLAQMSIGILEEISDKDPNLFTILIFRLSLIDVK